MFFGPGFFFELTHLINIKINNFEAYTFRYFCLLIRFNLNSFDEIDFQI